MIRGRVGYAVAPNYANTISSHIYWRICAYMRNIQICASKKGCTTSPNSGWFNVWESGNQIPRLQMISWKAKTPNIRCFVAFKGKNFHPLKTIQIDLPLLLNNLNIFTIDEKYFLSIKQASFQFVKWNRFICSKYR